MLEVRSQGRVRETCLTMGAPSIAARCGLARRAHLSVATTARAVAIVAHRHRISSALSITRSPLADTIDAWLAGLTRPPGISLPARPPRCDNMAEDGAALSDMTPQPAANPDAQATVNDFLDYTEFFPSDLQRSLRLIKKLDLTCGDAVQSVHELTVKYGTLPTIPANERPDPTTLRRDIAATLEKAIQCRESTFAEASRLYEVAERHCQRIKIIKRKLQALPEPPSRDPTPVPVSPKASRSLNRAFDRAPHLRLTFGHGASSAARPRDRKRTAVPLPGARARSLSSSDGSGSEVRSTIDLAVSPRKLKRLKDKTARPPKPRVRVPGAGTNVHSSIAGISTSNALARLSPPPADAKPGSKWAPWFKLTEYEMAVLRKKMKKNAVWTPSETMIKKQLEAGRRGQEFYDREKARCEAAGIEMLDEEPAVPSVRSAAPPPAAEPAPAAISIAVQPPPSKTTETVLTPIEPPSQATNDDSASPSIATDTANRGDEGSVVNDTRLSKRESQRRQARLDAKELEDATKRIKGAADKLMEMSFNTPPSSRRKSAARTPANHKRKRDSSPPVTVETPTSETREPSLASQDSGTKQPDPKRLRILPPLAPAPVSVSTPRTLTPAAPSPVSNTPASLPESTKTTSIQIPLAPAGPSTPKPLLKTQSKTASRHATPAVSSPTFSSTAESMKSPVAPTAPPPAAVTAASTRSRRESVAPKAVSPPPAPVQSAKVPKPVTTPALDVTQPPVAQPTRPRSARGHVPTPKAQSEEPKPHESDQANRELRRHSIFSQSALAAPTRTSSRKKPPPKGDITAGEDGQKTVTNVKRAQGNKNKKKKRTDEDSEPQEEIDPDEPRYCICDDVSFGQMISCDNNVSQSSLVLLTSTDKHKCEKEWFHLECVGMAEKDIPSRRAKWYCPDCRVHMNTNAYGNPLVPPSLPGRRGHR